jgi:Uri superfamily endonuclease
LKGDKRGTYLFIFHLRGDLKVKTRGGKTFYLPRGVYIYVGSAFGGGGIPKRVGRHLKRSKPLRWHLDYITTSEEFEFIGVIPFWGKKVECKLAGLLRKIPKTEPIKGFGCSDCKCESHLFRLKT